MKISPCRWSAGLWTAAALATAALPAAAQEFRGLWADAWSKGFQTPKEARALVEHCRAYNFNAIIVQMRRRGDAYYMPHLPNAEPRNAEIEPNYDALQDLITLCHQGERRIQVHCWVTTFLVWSGDKAAPPNHVVNRHPEYLMENSAGLKTIGEGMYLDPGNPEACRWVYEMAKDIVTHYDIDGFHWDYVRYPASDSGYNPTAIARFNQEFGRQGNPSAADEQFSNWRRRQVSDFLLWCNADLLDLKPGLVISCSVFGNRSDAFAARFQDWARWNQLGLMDLCMPMIYTPDVNVFETRVADAAANAGVRWVCAGQGAYMCTKEGTLEQLRRVRSRNLHGYVFYSYRACANSPGDRATVFSYLKNSLQPDWQPAPELPWKTNGARTILKGVVVREDNKAPIYNAVVTMRKRSMQTELHGMFAFYHAQSGQATVSATAPGLGVVTTNVTLTSGRMTTVNLTVPVHDRTPPVISNVRCDCVSDCGARIRWLTDENAASIVQYSSAAQSPASTTDESLVVQHTVMLQRLLPSTTYRCTVSSADAEGNTTKAPEIAFTTLAAGVVPEIIVDNPQAKAVGMWFGGNSSADKFGADYQFKSRGGGAGYVEYAPDIAKEGEYQVYEWHSQGVNRSIHTPHQIRHRKGDERVAVNQSMGGGQWNLLGTYEFAPGATNVVRITDDVEPGKVAVADAVKFVYVPREPQEQKKAAQQPREPAGGH